MLLVKQKYANLQRKSFGANASIANILSHIVHNFYCPAFNMTTAIFMRSFIYGLLLIINESHSSALKAMLMEVGGGKEYNCQNIEFHT